MKSSFQKIPQPIILRHNILTNEASHKKPTKKESLIQFLKIKETIINLTKATCIENGSQSFVWTKLPKQKFNKKSREHETAKIGHPKMNISSTLIII